jgi:predicted nucleic acid-binding protein
VIVVADTSPLLYLSRIAQLDLLHTLYGDIVVPATVWQETLLARPDADGIEALRTASWIIVSTRPSEPESMPYSRKP